MSEWIYEALDRQFKKHRIVFWYDPEGTMEGIFQGYQRDSIKTIRLASNEFYVKYLLLRKHPTDCFLVYSPSLRPPASENWLLDLELEHYVFSTDEAAMYVQELGLSDALKNTVSQRIGFFRNRRERLEPLKVLAQPEWGEEELLYAMLSLTSARTKKECQKIRPLYEIVVSLCDDREGQQRWDRVKEWRLDEFFFQQVKRAYGIELLSPEPKGVLLKLFQNALAFQSNKDHSSHTQSAYLFLETWRDSKEETESFETCAKTIAKELNVPDTLSTLSMERLVKVDIFDTADQLILQRILSELVADTADLSKTLETIKERKNSYWYRNDQEGTLKAWYDALEAACLLERSIRMLGAEKGFGATSIEHLWDRYCDELFNIDRLYRHFVLAYHKAGSSGSLAELYKRIDKQYLNGYLEPLANRWQTFLDENKSLSFARKQNSFFHYYILPYLREDTRLFVIISDGLRWEAGVELAERLLAKNRYKVDQEPLSALIPTYTAHGMAALLPHSALTLQPETGKVLVDNTSVEGLEGRSIFLDQMISAQFPGKRASALLIDDLLSMPYIEAEKKLKDFDLVYVYSDLIDSTGHKVDSSIPNAVEQEIQRIIDLVRKITSMNRSHILITADHGFLFSGNAFEDQFMLALEDLEGERYRDRRFILGFQLSEQPGLGLYGSGQPAFKEGATALVAKGLSKIRKKGPTGRYIHGGATLQELVIPVLRIKKLRSEEPNRVDISVLASTDITSPTIVLKFFQEQAVRGRMLPHRIVAQFESDTGEAISVKQDWLFDSTDPNDMNRSYALSFHFLPAAKKYIGKEVRLKLWTIAEGGTSIEYKTIPFRLRHLVLDVDFF